MKQDLWIKEVENPTPKPLDEWRNELFGFWMLVTDVTQIDGVRIVTPRYYGTDRGKIIDLWGEYSETAPESSVAFFCNKKSNWLGGAFLAKAES